MDRRKEGNGTFEKEWKERFERFAEKHDDDASIAGWSKSGLKCRYEQFFHYWVSSNPNLNTDRILWLDAGCGAGTYTRLLLEMGCSAIGLDYSFKSIIKAKSRAPDSSRWVVGDVRSLPFKKSTFDGVLCFGVTQTLSESDMLISQLAYVMKAGSQLWIDGLNEFFLPTMLNKIWTRHILNREPKVRYENSTRIVRLLESHGLTDIKLIWIPIIPEKFGILKKFVYSSPGRLLIQRTPLLGPVVSHSMLLNATKKN